MPSPGGREDGARPDSGATPWAEPRSQLAECWSAATKRPLQRQGRSAGADGAAVSGAAPGSQIPAHSSPESPPLSRHTGTRASPERPLCRPRRPPPVRAPRPLRRTSARGSGGRRPLGAGGRARTGSGAPGLWPLDTSSTVTGEGGSGPPHRVLNDQTTSHRACLVFSPDLARHNRRQASGESSSPPTALSPSRQQP